MERTAAAARARRGSARRGSARRGSARIDRARVGRPGQRADRSVRNSSI